MLNIEFREGLNDELGKLINTEFHKYAEKNGLVSNYKSYVFIAKEGEKVAILHYDTTKGIWELIGIEEVDGEYQFHTKGTANQIEDPIVYEHQVFGKVIRKFAILSILGRITTNMSTLLMFITIPIAVLIAIEIIKVYKSKDDEDDDEEDDELLKEKEIDDDGTSDEEEIIEEESSTEEETIE